MYEDIDKSDLVKFVMCTLVSRLHMTFYIITNGYPVPGNQGTHAKLNQIKKVRNSLPEADLRGGI